MRLFKLKLGLAFSLLYVVLGKCNETGNNKPNDELFKQLFKIRRAEQLEGVKKIRKLPEHKQYQMLQTVIITILKVILKSKAILETAGYVPGESAFPENKAVKDALSLVLENTALIGELILRMPEVTETVLRSIPEWRSQLTWSLGFAKQSGLLDTGTATLLDLVRQELNLATRSPDYINPYRQINKHKAKPEQEKEQIKKKKKRAELPRGPRLTHGEL